MIASSLFHLLYYCNAVGKVNIPISNFWNKGIVDQWLALGTTLSKTGHGEIHLLINYNESGQMKTPMNMMGQGMGMNQPMMNTNQPMMNQPMMVGSSGTTTTTTTDMPGSNIATGSMFQTQPTTTTGGYVQSTASYPPPMGTHGDSSTHHM